MIHWARRSYPALILLLVLASLGGGFHWGISASRVLGG